MKFARNKVTGEYYNGQNFSGGVKTAVRIDPDNTAWMAAFRYTWGDTFELVPAPDTLSGGAANAKCQYVVYRDCHGEANPGPLYLKAHRTRGFNEWTTNEREAKRYDTTYGALMITRRCGLSSKVCEVGSEKWKDLTYDGPAATDGIEAEDCD